MNKRGKYLERKLVCAVSNVKKLEEKNSLLKVSLEEMKQDNEILTEHLE